MWLAENSNPGSKRATTYFFDSFKQSEVIHLVFLTLFKNGEDKFGLAVNGLSSSILFQGKLSQVETPVHTTSLLSKNNSPTKLLLGHCTTVTQFKPVG
jgi:hypothetical protein